MHSPKLGGKVAAIKDEDTLAIAGVKTVVNLEHAVAVVAADYWSAERGLKALKVKWALPETSALDENEMWQLLKDESQKRGQPVVNRGNIDTMFKNQENSITREYSLPYYAHACMEAMTCIADVKSGSCEIWAPTQAPWATYHQALQHGLSSFSRLRERIWLKFNERASDRIKIRWPFSET